MKILITGAHFTPAIALIEELKKTKDLDIVYIGRKNTMEGDLTPSKESQIIPTLGVKFISITTGRLQRSFTRYTIPSLLKIPIGFIQSVWIIWTEKPNVILSFGGYVALPLVVIGWLFSIPILIHEQTLVSGLANKISSFFADKITLSFDKNQKLENKRIVLTGNPIRNIVLNPKRNLDLEYRIFFENYRKEKLPIILVMGGNQGSHIINEAISQCFDKLIRIALVIHITGDNKFLDFEKLKKLENDHYLVKKWIGEEYGTILSKVDLVISRAGVNTLTELAFAAKPALVIPIPYLYQDEQNKNAKYFEKLSLVKILPQYDLSGKSLFENIKGMLSKLGVYRDKAKKAKQMIIPDAAKRLALETFLLIHKSK